MPVTLLPPTHEEDEIEGKGCRGQDERRREERMGEGESREGREGEGGEEERGDGERKACKREDGEEERKEDDSLEDPLTPTRQRRILGMLLVLFLAGLCIPHRHSMSASLSAMNDNLPKELCGIQFEGDVPFLYTLPTEEGAQFTEKLSFPLITKMLGLHPVLAKEGTVMVAEKACIKGINTDLVIQEICVQGSAAHCVSTLPHLPDLALERAKCMLGLGDCRTSERRQ